jgi:two-component system nitrate/nitrite response regulator NarL
MATRVLIVDDHAGFRSIARRLLQTGGYDVVGEAHDGSSALAAARALQPDLVLLDIQLPDVDGCQVARWLTAQHDSPAVILVSSREASDYGPRLQACGARGFLSKAELTHTSLAAVLHES